MLILHGPAARLSGKRDKMEGKFSTKYFFTGKGKETWFKTLGIGWRLVFIAIILFTIYRAYFVKTQTQHNTITAQPGSTVNVIQKTNEKRAWWMPTPFVDMYAFVETNDRSGFGGRAGCRWEF